MLPTTQPKAPARPTPQSEKRAGTRLPAKGMMTSLGSGMQALSMAIRPAIPA